MNYSKVIIEQPAPIITKDAPTTSSSGIGSSCSPTATTPTSSRKGGGLAKLLRQRSSKNEGDRSGSVSPSSEASIPPPPTPKSPKSPKAKKTGFASRSVRKREWRLFKHRAFFGSQRSSTKRNHNSSQFQLPRLTVRHPSIDSTTAQLQLEEAGYFRTQRRYTESETTTRLRDSRESSGFHDDLRETFDPSTGSSNDVLPSHSMTAPVSPNVPLSASSSHSDGWKYSSQKLLWKLKPKYINFSHASSTSSSTDSAWKSLDSNTWRSVDGAEVILKGTRLERLSECERTALQAISITRLSKLLPGVSVVKQKDALSALRQKRLKLVKSTKALAGGEKQHSSDGGRRPSNSSGNDNRVFGVSLADCMENERRLEEAIRCRSLDDASVGVNGPALPAGCQQDVGQSRHLMKQKAKPVHSETELIKWEDRRWLYPSSQNMCISNPSSPGPLSSSLPTKDYSTSVTFLLATEPDRETVTGRFVKKSRVPSSSLSWSLDCPPDELTDIHSLQVPRIVDNCIKYLIEHGLHQLGLFRVAGNATRCRQLRNALEKAGGEMNCLSDDATAVNDIAAILKEYFRDLPQPLLPKEHYQAYIAAAKLPFDDRVECVRHLVSLLNPPNLDTLFVLMKFLHQVSLNCMDRCTEDGSLISGNKMDGRNLATIFAPCILRADHDKLQASLAENEQQICIIETIILDVETIFTIPKSLQCQIYNRLRETEPDRLDRILNNLSRIEGVEFPYSPFPATLEEDSPRDTHRTTGSSTEGDNAGAEFDRTPKTNKKKIVTQRSGSWPFSLVKPTPSKEELRFFTGSTEESPRPERHEGRGRRDTQSLAPGIEQTASIARPSVSPCSSISPSTTDSPFRYSNRLSAARRRLRNVVRVFRFYSVTRSVPNVTSTPNTGRTSSPAPSYGAHYNKHG